MSSKKKTIGNTVARTKDSVSTTAKLIREHIRPAFGVWAKIVAFVNNATAIGYEIVVNTNYY